ncbi:MAG: acyl carrier protein [Tissierellia bacterium]|nr:acyl carrier protein [Tissierellia bacterium]
MDTKAKVIEILKGINDEYDPEADTDIIDGGVLDSFDIVSFVIELNDAFGINIGVDKIVPENFGTLDAIVAMVEGLKE